MATKASVKKSDVTVNSDSSGTQKTEVRIGLVDSVSPLVIESATSQDEIVAAAKTALASSEPLVLTDVKNRQILVAPAKITYIEVGVSTERKVGFGAV